MPNDAISAIEVQNHSNVIAAFEIVRGDAVLIAGHVAPARVSAFSHESADGAAHVFRPTDCAEMRPGTLWWRAPIGEELIDDAKEAIHGRSQNADVRFTLHRR
jgi:hypothetical protein